MEWWWILVLDLIIFAPLTGWLAQQKKRPFHEGAIVGAAFGILGILVIGLAPVAEGTPKPMSTLTKILLVAIFVLLVWLALGTPGLSGLY